MSALSLTQLHADIDARVQAIRENRPEWPCAKGCDGCCRRLAGAPQLTPAEWSQLREGLATLSPESLRQVSRNMAGLAAVDGERPRHIVCPLLDRSANACLVYAQRPVACRTYGFYVQRRLGLYCHDFESRVAAGMLVDVVWGNHEAIDRQLAGFGEGRPLSEWFEGWDVL